MRRAVTTVTLVTGVAIDVAMLVIVLTVAVLDAS